jgi:hypothetical protein
MRRDGRKGPRTHELIFVLKAVIGRHNPFALPAICYMIKPGSHRPTSNA